MVDLGIDLLQHLLGEDDTLIAAFEVIFTAKIGVLMEDDLIHVELVKIRVQQGDHNGFQFHSDNLL